MIVKNLTINNFKGLKNFSVQLDDPLVVIIGINGSGKSSLLEALAWIFGNCYLSFVKENANPEKIRKTPFEFKLTYEIKIDRFSGQTSTALSSETLFADLTITGSNNNRNFYEFSAQKGKYTVEEIIGQFGYEKIFPSRVNLYYSGISDHLKLIAAEYLAEFKSGLRGFYSSKDGNIYNSIKLPFYYFEPNHFPLLLASLYAYEYNFDLDKFFSEELGFTKPKGSAIGITIKKRQFTPKATADTFWGAEGEVKRFLNLLKETASNSQYREERDEFLFIFDLVNWYEIKDQIGEEKTLFDLLYVLEASELLKEVNVFCTLNNRKSDISFHHLSEGQKQKITVRAFYELLQVENSLFLLDEPETYLHPQWQDDFILEVSEYTDDSNYFITSHSPILISNLKKGNLVSMSNGVATKIPRNYFGRDYSNSLEDLMHTPPRNAEVLEKIRNIFELIDKNKIESATAAIEAFEGEYGTDDGEILRAKSLLEFLS